MKIKGISTVVVNARMRNWIFVKVETDQPGLYGWGEATLEWKTKGVVGAIEDLSALLIGQDSRRVEHLWQIMHRQYFWRGGITNMTALSGIDRLYGTSKARCMGYLSANCSADPFAILCGSTTIWGEEHWKECI